MAVIWQQAHAPRRAARVSDKDKVFLAARPFVLEHVAVFAGFSDKTFFAGGPVILQNRPVSNATADEAFFAASAPSRDVRLLSSVRLVAFVVAA